MKRKILCVMFLALAMTLCSAIAMATETENIGMKVLPAPGKVTIDGKYDDWDLSGGIFTCSDVENLRDQYSVWFFAMYDDKNVYLLTFWNDPTPLNNPGSSKGDMGFQGDCLQVRFITNYEDKAKELVSHWTCWRDRDGLDVMDLCYGRDFKGGGLRDAKAKGAQQAFAVNTDGKSYLQEMSIPWALLTKDGQQLQLGEAMHMALEPNFTAGAMGRVSIKDIFKDGVVPDRTFTFQAFKGWGVATLEKAGKIKPRSVRLSDSKEFEVSLGNPLPSVNWSGLIAVKELSGFKPISFNMSEDGYVSLIIKDKSGAVVRHLLNCAFYTKGEHATSWDGLATPVWKSPGKPVDAGEYIWSAISHKGIGLRLRGFACNGGSVPWDAGDSSNWGGDHGVPICCATDGQKIYLGWSGAEAGKALLACDAQGSVQWKNSRGGVGQVELVAADGGIVYAQSGSSIYRVESGKGGYTFWKGKDSVDLPYTGLFDGVPDHADGMAAGGGKLFLSFEKANSIAILDANSGELLGKIEAKSPGSLAMGTDGKLFAISGDRSVISMMPDKGQTAVVVADVPNAKALAVDKAGRLYVGLGHPDNQVVVFSPDGKVVGAIGAKGGRPTVGPWKSDGMAFIAGIVVDQEGKLWVMESDQTPKRVGVWDTKTGKLVKEFFGPTHYGASGGAILPADPNVMVGEGCEWKLDPETGRAICTGIFDRNIAGSARFCTGTNKRTYLVTGRGLHALPYYKIFERIGEGDYKLRGTISSDNKTNKTTFWADANDDGQVQQDEVQTYDDFLNSSGYIALSEWINTDLTFYATASPTGAVRIPVSGFTSCNAPKYDLAKVQKIPAAGLASPDNSKILEWTDNNLKCYDMANGMLRWSYPNTFSGVHGSHYAPGPEMGLLRGCFGTTGNAVLPKPLGAIWGLNGNCGEWYIFNEDGYFVTQLFQGDPMKTSFPDKAVPGVVLNNCPPGLGAEDFGGSMCQGDDGKIYIQSGKTGLWNLEVVGLESVREIQGGTLKIGADDVNTARKFFEAQMQVAEGTKSYTVIKGTPTFTGNIDTDFKSAKVAFEKQAGSKVRCAAAWDGNYLYLGWDVQDDTPWVNGADAPEFMYARGDTVDFQIGTNPNVDKKRAEPVKGDVRLSIGNFNNKPTAVAYRKVADNKAPKTFSSGVVREYVIDSVVVLDSAKIEVKADVKGRKYVVEAAIPLPALELNLTDGLVLRGDFGATHGDKTGTDTALRTYWNNQQTGLVSDEVYELMMEPRNWGEFKFAQ